MRYMIHSAPPRQWYVDEFLIPSLLKQGIPEKQILVRCDTEGKGNLISCMEAFQWCGQHTDNGTWHIQDDVIICRKFAKLTKKYNQGVVCGAVVKEWGPDYTRLGIQPVKELWYSFQCIRVPDQLAGECAGWFFSYAMKKQDPEYIGRIRRRKHDDDFFRYFLLEKHPDMQILNLKPNLVDHIDYMLGGSLINADRGRDVNRMYWFEDKDLVDQLDDILERRQNDKK